MDHQEYIRHLNHSPNHPNYVVSSRVYRNAAGIDEMIFLNKGYWDYVDWLEETTDDIDFSDWVVHCDNNMWGDHTLSSLLMYWLWFDQCNRFRQGLPTHKPCPPMGYEGWADDLESGNSVP